MSDAPVTLNPDLGQPDGSADIPRYGTFIPGEDPQSIQNLKRAYRDFVKALNGVTAPMPVHDLTGALGRWLGIY